MQVGVARVEHAEVAFALFFRDTALCGLCFDPDHSAADDLQAWLQRRFGRFAYTSVRDPGGACARLRDYLQGDLGALDALAVDTGGTAFQRRVWHALREVGPGRTASYLDIARAIGQPGAARAVGMANSRNPVAVVVPCHRIIQSDGGLGGYTGGLDRKRWLLRHEGVTLDGDRVLG